jgi:hypothetical protein
MSYEKIVSVDSKDETDQHEKDFGRFNDPPPNFTEITAEEFAQSGFFTWCIEAQEFRQIDPARIDQNRMLSPVSTYLSVKMFFMNHGDGYALAQDYWGKKIRYFKFAKCLHDYQEVSAASLGKPAFNSYHYCKCTKCGDLWEYDSSG